MSARVPAAEADIIAAATILDRLNVSVDDLLASRRERPPAPTFAEYVPVVYAAMKPTRTRDNHLSYWNKIVKHWPDRRIDEPTATDLAHMINVIRSERSIRSTDRGGHGVARATADALRCLYRHAEQDRIIDAAHNPARQIDRTPQQKSSRRALPDTLLAQMYEVAADGQDPELHSILFRLHLETACRRGGALALQPDDLNPLECLIRLREKGGTERWQPVSPTLMGELCHHRDQRIPTGAMPQKARNGRPISATANRRLLRYRNGHPITVGCYDALWGRIRAEIPTAAALHASTHWLRHTTLKWVERNFGVSIAKAYWWRGIR
ncbi:site-specific integrase [Nocardia terpenica]|uniref:Integrase n=1 Tax=Nocardia terpenica TaxID=455432 RepID=A0A291RPB6_9NOCA|nr:site-specific integrase [Nocardia terpenica]ATL69167.1 integrase [Nocardia terpenica]